MAKLVPSDPLVVENYPLWGSYVCDMALPGKGSPRPIAERFRLLSFGLGYPHMTNMLMAGCLPGSNAYIAKGAGVRVCFSHVELYELAKDDLTIDFMVNDFLVETLALDKLIDHEDEDFDPFPSEVSTAGISRVYRLEPPTHIDPGESFDLILNLKRDLLVALQSAEWALRFHPDSDMPHGLDWRPYVDWYAEIRGFLVGDYIRAYI